MDWPSQSPNLNPVENLWEELDRKVREENFTNKKNLFAALHQKGKNIPIDKLIKLVNSMPQRCAAVITSKARRYLLQAFPSRIRIFDWGRTMLRKV